MYSRLLRTVLGFTLFLGLTAQVSPLSAQSYSAGKAQERAVRQLEEVLEVRGDRSGSATWYVLAFSDQAKRISKRLSLSTPAYNVYDIIGEFYFVKNALVVQGRRGAAEAVLQYLHSGNAALEKMPRINSPNTYVFGKFWDFRTFASQVEARSLHATLTAPKTSSASSHGTPDHGTR